jgi:hypothetical protein
MFFSFYFFVLLGENGQVFKDAINPIRHRRNGIILYNRAAQSFIDPCKFILTMAIESIASEISSGKYSSFFAIMAKLWIVPAKAMRQTVDR